jgi:carboxymethylenebutenolidase
MAPGKARRRRREGYASERSDEILAGPMSEVKIPTPQGEMPGYLATPTADGPWPGVVVIHDALGMSTDIRNQTDWLAGEGYLAVAPDLYYWGRRIRCLISTVRLGARPLSELDATRSWLAELDNCSGHTGVIGFCMGGDFALMMAPRRGVSAASVNYGGATNDLERALPDVCPIVGSFGAKDRWPGARRVPDRLESILTEAGVEHDIKVYPGAGHGFINDHDPAELPLWVRVIAKLAAAEYDETAARDARRRIIAFFRMHLS